MKNYHGQSELTIQELQPCWLWKGEGNPSLSTTRLTVWISSPLASRTPRCGLCRAGAISTHPSFCSSERSTLLCPQGVFGSSQELPRFPGAASWHQGRLPVVPGMSLVSRILLSFLAPLPEKPIGCHVHVFSASRSLGDLTLDVHFLNVSFFFFLICLFFLTGSLWSPRPKRRGRCQTLWAHALKGLGVDVLIASFDDVSP